MQRGNPVKAVLFAIIDLIFTDRCRGGVVVERLRAKRNHLISRKFNRNHSSWDRLALRSYLNVRTV